MDNYKKTSETWNKVAWLYEKKFMDLDLYNTSYDFICRSIPKNNADILEIGCGPGNITKYLLSKRPDFNISGIDIAPNMIKLAEKNNPNASFRVMDSRNIGELQTKYDGIVGGFCLPYLSQADSEKLIADSNKLLNNKGLLYLSFVEGSYDQSGFQTGSSGDSVYFYFHELDSIIKTLSSKQFNVLKIFKVDFKKTAKETEVHTIITAEKKIQTPE